MRRLKHILLLPIFLAVPLAVQAETVLPGLTGPVTVVRDSNGIPHILAETDLDAFFMQGWVHAEDRLFQMDTTRRFAKGTVAELFGPTALRSDFESRTLGLGRASERSLAAHSDAMKAALEAYSKGVNAFIDLAETTGRLPPEYGALELTRVDRWTPLDSVLVAKAIGFRTSMLVDRDIELTRALAAYQATGQVLGSIDPALGFDGTALFFEDLYRSAPFDPASTVPDAERPSLGVESDQERSAVAGEVASDVGPKALALARKYLRRMRELPRIPGIPRIDGHGPGGSNTWVVGGEHTSNGHPILANDAHLPLESPTIFHQLHLATPDMDVVGSSIPGAPCVVRGQNRDLAWGLTNSRLDITDIYREAIVPFAGSPSGLATLHDGVPEPIVPLPQGYFVNLPADGVPDNVVPASLILPEEQLAEISLVLIVPRRNNGALITPPQLDPGTGTLSALSIQSIAFSPTRDPEGICGLNRARNLGEFTTALQLIDFASQNVSYADAEGNIAYFITGEVPLREDLQNPVPGQPIRPPFLIREGTGGQDWIPVVGAPPENQATAFEILPFAEMPQTVNPPSGVIVNANNDQAGNTLDNNPLNQLRPGGGIHYLNWGGHNFSIRAGRITRLLAKRIDDGDLLNTDDMIRIQSDVVMPDARLFTRYILRAFRKASSGHAHPALAALAADPRVQEAVDRLHDWDFSTPTGIAEGYDARRDDDDDDWDDDEQDEIENSIAASIYSVWRGRMVATSIDAVLDAVGVPAVLDALGLEEMPKPREREEVVTALKHLLETDGIGVSGLNFFVVPGVADPTVRRDIVVLAALRDALDQLASDDFAPAFGNSANQDDYRWGKLHRIVFKHSLGDVAEVFNVPPAFGLFLAPLEGLAGIPTDGGFETVDVAPPLDDDVRVTDSDSFMFFHGPTGRFVSRLMPGKVRSRSSLPGGESAVPFSPFYVNLLESWLLNETHPLLMSQRRIRSDVVSTQVFVPPAP